MNKLKKKFVALKKATDTQFKSIREKNCYKGVKADFDIEYQVALELAQARKEANLPQLQIAELMDTQQSVVSRIERGANVSVATVARYAAACGKDTTTQTGMSVLPSCKVSCRVLLVGMHNKASFKVKVLA